MSDCSRNTWKPYQAAMLRVEFAGEEPPWEQPIALCGREITGVLVDGERYERVRECVDIHGNCSLCGTLLEWGDYCHQCGAKVVE